MRIVVHDYAGHPFQMQLSRALAARGHDVLHAYCSSLQTTPRGSIDGDNTPPNLRVEGVGLRAPLEKSKLIRRFQQEHEYGRRIADVVERFGPDVVLSGNTPLDAQRLLWRACRRVACRSVFWVQDLIGEATYRLLAQRFPGVGHVIGGHYRRMERSLLRSSDRVVAITADFEPVLINAGVAGEDITVIENWAPIDEVPVLDKSNAWSRAHGLDEKRCALYAGTLALKHNPDLLLQLAVALQSDPGARVVVISQGPGADWLRKRRAELSLTNLVVLDFQPFSEMPAVMASADILLAILEPEAGVYSVPSKVLTYLCSARPTVLAVPQDNLAARIVSRQKAGVVVDPSDTAGFVDASLELLSNPTARDELGANARRYAERAFAIDNITDAFEAVLKA